ncbi:MAG: hypothetical protein HS104_26000 [Polyangiaceae bacterium]|nr:hypothetical protein [Polyangiaceae bacterium]MCE7894263.1 hypothetical protein [Sorangiineae bacterium PRO1]MCL4750634.1 hypothetical protein [Myxococcales bacterium]
MSKLYMLAGGIVEPGGGSAGRVSAFVAYNPRPGVSRLFKVHGAASEPMVSELPSATTIDLSAFRHELEQELEPELRAIGARGGAAAIAQPKADWIANVVRRHLAAVEGIEVG